MKKTRMSIGVAGALALAAAAPAAAQAGSPVAIEHRTLLVRGGAGADAVALEVSRWAPHVLRVDLGDDGSVDYEIRRSRFDRIRVESGAGEDEVRIKAPIHSQLEPIRYDGGDGFDQIVAEGSNAGERFELSVEDGVERLAHERTRASLHGVEAVEAFARGGSDTIDIEDLTGAELQSVTAELGTVLGFESADGATDRVTVEATNADDQIVAFGTSDFVSVFGTPETVSIANVDPGDRLTIDGRGGDDTISADSAISHTLHGGAGDDGLFGGPRQDLLVGGDGSDEAAGFGGDDDVHLGDDDDRFIWESGNGDDDVDGGSGHDSMRVVGADVPERFELFANGRELRVTRDLEAVAIDADDVEDVTTEALAGADTIAVGDLRRTDVEQVHAALAAGEQGPDGAADRVVVSGTERKDAITVTGEGRSATVAGLSALVAITEAEPLDALAIRTGAGNDTVDSSSLPAGIIGLVVD
jgi:hypothetical protein